ncbi:NACHT domain-containing protein [Streptomyces sp. NPDC051219]|uniref:NACHT domain-containing protein n=1 Tax=Streptomyces sp. NPDC051219 TaxID=3155283 RepID=UPI003445BE88
MDPAVIGARLASAAVAPLIRKLFVTEGPGAGLVDKPVRISGLVSFKGEKRVLTEKDVQQLGAELVRRALRAGERPVPPDEEQAVTDALTRTLLALGGLDIDDVQAVRLGHADLARRLRRAAPVTRHLSADATAFHDGLTGTACLHILHFFTQRSTFVARTLVEQSRSQAELIARIDELIARTPRPDARDAAFEQRYLAHVAKKHGKLTIYGIDLSNSPDRWPLNAAYLSLEALDADSDADHPAVAPNQPVAADQALAGHDRVLLRGVAGSGKTTLVQWLALSAARQDLGARMSYLHDRIPFVLPLRTLTRHGERLPAPDRFLSAIGSPLSGSQPDSWVDRVLSTGRGLLLVDGIDEIPDAERERTRDWLRDLLDAFPGNRWLVTSRPSAVRENWLCEDGFAELALSPMSPAGVAAFITRWHTAARGEGRDQDRLDAYETSLLAAVRTKSDLGRLATNPLMCGLICALHRDRRGFLPHGRKELYEAALTMLLARRDRERDMGAVDGIDLQQEAQTQLLQRLAYWLIRNGRTELDRERAERIISEALPAVPLAAAQGNGTDIFGHLLLRSGLLREPAPGAVVFVHRTFQDYLGARAAVEAWDIGLLIAHAADDQWEDVIRLAVAHARPRERAELLSDLLAAGDQAAGGARARIYLLAAACLEHATELDPAVAEAVKERASRLLPPRSTQAAHELAAVGPLVLDLLPGPEELTEGEAVNVVVTASRIPSDAAIPFLARFAGHSSLRVRSQLVWSWDRFDTQRYADEVVAGLDPRHLYFSIRTDQQLAALKALGGRPLLQTKGDLSVGDLTEYVRTASPVRIRLSHHSTLADVDFLRASHELIDLSVSHCGRLRDLSGLAGLPVRFLSLTQLGDIPHLRPLRTLDRLTNLTLALSPATRWTLDDLSSDASLDALDLVGSRGPESGYGGIGRWADLIFLRLGAESSPRTAADWADLAEAGRLVLLEVAAEALDSHPAGEFLPPVRKLHLRYESGRGPGLRRVPELFPELTDLHIVGSGYWGDLIPLRDLPWLERIHLPGGAESASGAADLPDHVEILES